MRTLHCNGFEILRPHHSAGTRPRRLPSAVVCDTREPYQILPRRPNARHPPAMSQPPFDRALRLQSAESHQLTGVKKFYFAIVYGQQARLFAPARDNERIAARLLQLSCHETGRQRIPDESRERRLGKHRKLAGSGKPAANKWTGNEYKRIVRRKRFYAGRTMFVQQIRAKTRAPNEAAQHIRIQLLPAARPASQINNERPAIIAVQQFIYPANQNLALQKSYALMRHALIVTCNGCATLTPRLAGKQKQKIPIGESDFPTLNKLFAIQV